MESAAIIDAAHQDLHALLDPKRQAVEGLRQELRLLQNRDGMMMQESDQKKSHIFAEMAVLEGQCDAIEAVLTSPAASSRAKAAEDARRRQAAMDADTSPFAHTQRLLRVQSEEEDAFRRDRDGETRDAKNNKNEGRIDGASTSSHSPTSSRAQSPQKIENRHRVQGWARSTHFVTSLLWHSRVAIPETALFDEHGAIQDHLFCSASASAAPSLSSSKNALSSTAHSASMPLLHSSHARADARLGRQLGVAGSSSRSSASLHSATAPANPHQHVHIDAPYVLRCNRQHTTLDHVFSRLQKKSRLAGTPLVAVDRRQGTHGAVLSESGLDVRLDKLRARFSRPEGSGDNMDNGGDFCIQQYVEPVGGIRYEVTCARLPPEGTFVQGDEDVGGDGDAGAPPKDHKCIAIDIVPSSYADVYEYPSNYAPPSRYQQRGVAPPPMDLRQRMCTTALSVLRHAEVSHDVWMTRVVLEMVLSTSHNPKPASKSRKSSSTDSSLEVVVTGARCAEWVMAPGAWENLRAAPRVVRGTGPEAMMESDIAFEASDFQVAERDEDEMEDEVGGSGRADDGEAGIGAKRRRSRPAGKPAPSANRKNNKLARPESAPTLGPQATLAVRRQARAHYTQSRHNLTTSARPRLRSMQRTLHASAGSAVEASRPAFGPTSSHPAELQPSASAGLLGGSSSNEDAAPTLGASRFGGGLSSGALSVQQLRRTGGLGGLAAKMGQERVGGAEPGGMKGGLLTNIRVAGRSGRDELHVQLSTALRKAQQQCKTSEGRIDLLVAKQEGYVSKIAGLEAAHGRLRKTLRTTEANLETHQLDARQRINALQKMLVQTQHRLTKSEANEARERSLRIAKQRALENVDAAKEVLQVRHDELAKRLSLVADLEKNGAKFRSSRERLQADHDTLMRTHEILLSEAEELRQRLGMAEEELIQQRSLRHTLFTLLGDLSTPGVRPPKRVAGGYSTYPRPSRRNVAKAVKLVVDGELAHMDKKRRRLPRKRGGKRGGGGAGVGVSGLRNMRAARNALGQQDGKASPGGTVDTPGVVRQLKNFMKHKRSLYGREVTTAKKLFNQIDSDGDGAVTTEELAAGLDRLDMGLQPTQILTLLQEADADNSGTIELSEFVRVVDGGKGRTRRRRNEGKRGAGGGEERVSPMVTEV